MAKRKSKYDDFITMCEKNKKLYTLATTSTPSCNLYDSVNLRSPSPNVDGVSDSPYTSSNLRTDGQPDCSGSDCLQQSSPDGKPGRGLPSIDNMQNNFIFGRFPELILYGLQSVQNTLRNAWSQTSTFSPLMNPLTLQMLIYSNFVTNSFYLHHHAHSSHPCLWASASGLTSLTVGCMNVEVEYT